MILRLKVTEVFFKYVFMYLFVAALGLCSCTRACSSCSGRGLLSSCGAWASHCGGFSCRTWALGLCCPTACGIFQDRGSNPCPLHWQVDSSPLDHEGSPKYVFKMPGDKHHPFHLQTPCPVSLSHLSAPFPTEVLQ